MNASARWLCSYLLILGVLWVVCGCTSLPGLLAPVSDAVGILCETRPDLMAAQDALDQGNIQLAIELLRRHLAEHLHDHEAEAVLNLLETQTDLLVHIAPF